MGNTDVGWHQTLVVPVALACFSTPIRTAPLIWRLFWLGGSIRISVGADCLVGVLVEADSSPQPNWYAEL